MDMPVGIASSACRMYDSPCFQASDGVGVDRELIERASTARNSVQAIRTFFASRGIALSDKTAWNHWRQVASGKPDKALSKALVNEAGA